MNLGKLWYFILQDSHVYYDYFLTVLDFTFKGSSYSSLFFFFVNGPVPWRSDISDSPVSQLLVH